jgi:hypothetical protein
VDARTPRNRVELERCKPNASRQPPQPLTPRSPCPLLQFSVKPSIATARWHAGAGLLAVGGREHDLAVWDVAAGKPVFEARNVAQTTLALRVPVWVAGVAFLPEAGAAAALGGSGGGASASTAPASSSGFVLATVTGHKHVRIYDTRAGDRRPMRSVDMGDHAFTALELAPDGRSVLTGDAAGVLRRVDLGTLKQVGGYKGVGGAVKALAVRGGGASPSSSSSSSSSQQPLMASVGLDRALRVHHIGTRKLLRRVHLKQRLTAVLFAPEQAPAVGAEDGDDDVEVEDELLPEPPPDGRIRITQRRVEADPTRARDEKDVDGAAGGGDEDADEVWRELDRRAALAKATGGSGGSGGARSASAAAAPAGGAKRARPAAAAAAAPAEVDDEDDDDSDDEEDDIDDRIDGDNDGAELAEEGDDDDSEEDEDDDDDSELSGFTDEEDDDGKGKGGSDSDDGDDSDGDGDGDDDDDDDASSDGPNSEDEAAALVDSRDAARAALRQTKLAQIAKAKGRAPPAAAMGGPHQKKGKPQAGGGGGGKGRGGPPAKQARR